VATTGYITSRPVNRGDGVKLAHKGLIILLLPVAFELAFASTVGDLLKQVDVQIAKETSGADGMMAMETLWLDVLRANYAAVGYHCTRDASFLREHDEVMQDIALNMKLLRQAAGNDPKRHNLVDSVVMGQVRQLRQRRKLMNAWEDARQCPSRRAAVDRCHRRPFERRPE
jgi:CHASE3 domain sensor protein